MHIVALINSQGTACLETALMGDEDTTKNRIIMNKRAACIMGIDPPVPGSWTDVSDNPVFIDHFEGVIE